jgi:hypothetical protein
MLECCCCCLLLGLLLLLLLLLLSWVRSVPPPPPAAVAAVVFDAGDTQRGANDSADPIDMLSLLLLLFEAAAAAAAAAVLVLLFCGVVLLLPLLCDAAVTAPLLPLLEGGAILSRIIRKGGGDEGVCVLCALESPCSAAANVVCCVCEGRHVVPPSFRLSLSRAITVVSCCIKVLLCCQCGCGAVRCGANSFLHSWERDAPCVFFVAFASGRQQRHATCGTHPRPNRAGARANLNQKLYRNTNTVPP